MRRHDQLPHPVLIQSSVPQRARQDLQLDSKAEPLLSISSAPPPSRCPREKGTHGSSSGVFAERDEGAHGSRFREGLEVGEEGAVGGGEGGEEAGAVPALSPSARAR